MRGCRGFLVIGLAAGSCAWLSAQTPGTALVRHAPTLNGAVEGSVQVMTAENVTFNSSAAVTGNLLVPGMPTVRLNGRPAYGGTQDGSGAAAPSNYSITLNSGASLGHVVRRTDPVSLVAVANPPASAGTRSVSLNKSGQNPGDFATIRNLTLNGNVGQIVVPAGIYGDFTANGGGGFTLGVAGAIQPASYALQHLTLNGNARLEIAGPVDLTVANAVTFNGNAGSADHPAWLQLKVAAGGVTLNGGSSLSGRVTAPNGTVIINGNSQLVGTLACDRLTLNGNGLLQLIVVNQPPTVIMTAPSDGASVIAFTALTLTATADDGDGTISQVEFFNGSTKLGDGTRVAGQNGVFSFSLLAGLPAGSYTFTAKATDNQGTSTVSAPVTISVTLAPNKLPQVTLTAPAAGATLVANVAVCLLATATDPDGTVAKVEFYDGATKLGDGATKLGDGAPIAGQALEFSLQLSAGFSPGNHALTARATDDDGAFKDSAPVSVTVLASLPYSADFEAAEGYVLGPLAGQLGWSAGQGAPAVTNEACFSGARSVVLPPGTPPAKMAQAFAPLAGQGIIFVDFYAKPVADAHVNSATTFDVESARFAFVRNGANGELRAFNGDGAGGGEWLGTGFAALLAADGEAQSWIRLTLRLDFARKTWDLYANGTMVATDPGFRDNTRTSLTLFAVQGHAAAATRLDYLLAATENPLFADADNDGMDDAWETANGLDPTVNDRNGDQDGDGLTNLCEYLLGTRANLVDTDGDGLPDGWEVAHHLNPLQMGAPTDDTDHDGLSDLQEYTSDTDPNNADTDGDGMPDGWEVTRGLNPRDPTDAALDPDGDGLSNLQEYQHGSDPNEFFNGASPQVEALNNGGPGPADELAMVVRKPDGTPWPNAPATFEITSGNRRIAASPGGPGYSTIIQVRSGADGVARVYLEPLQP